MKSPKLMHRKLAVLLASTAAVVPVAPAMAQVDEIIVQARKTSEKLQEVPISITAFSGEDFESAGLQEFQDLQFLTPNLDVEASGAVSSTFVALSIRGQTSGFLTVNFDEAVGIYFNGAPITRSTGIFSNLFDVEAVEVLKGPQGVKPRHYVPIFDRVSGTGGRMPRA